MFFLFLCDNQLNIFHKLISQLLEVFDRWSITIYNQHTPIGNNCNLEGNRRDFIKGRAMGKLTSCKCDFAQLLNFSKNFF